ncbi:glycine cleavage T-C-terminal barrel domain protein [Neorickettsia helminthoeca str. Oregon]|uniref:Glycine cleavage T-C-terminal barrel domain protein n=1 Tax=Neorickettsia helminthoeca str. Oregon TaxID=1286528 RepID=X5H3I9_9RICK|nr:folate-binding protein YgfZ [Neorickettsia helminthoeca]AHX11263.1 glycine cleavage T-C-terminal barrel domain protein [Neorickettsia helminthoeca str. Oregon]
MNCFKVDTVLYLITGKNVKSFLQGIITRNIGYLKDCIYALILTPKGRLICDLFVYSYDASSILLETHSCNKEAILSLLNLYNFKKTIEVKEKFYSSYITFEVTDSDDHIICVKDPRSASLGFRVITSGAAYVSSMECSERYQLERIRNKIPEAGKELTFNVFPLDYGLNYAFDFDKGCYVGQEVISRFRLQGLVKRELFCVECTGGVHFEEGESLSVNGEIIGYLSSCCGNCGLILLEKDKISNFLDIQYKANKVIIS